MNECLVTLDDGMRQIKPYLSRLEAMVDAHREGAAVPHFSRQEYMTVFTIVYNMTTQKKTHNYSEQLYQLVRRYTDAYATRVVAPALRSAMRNGSFLTSLDREWQSFSQLAKWTNLFFNYLNRSHAIRQNVPHVRLVAMLAFEKVALSAALSADCSPRSYAALTLVYIRSKYPTSISTISPLYDLDQSLYTLAGFNAMLLARRITGAEAMATLMDSARTIAEALPTETCGNPYVGWSLRQFLIDRVTDFAFLRRVDDIVPPLAMNDDVALAFSKTRHIVGMGPRITPDDVICHISNTSVETTGDVWSLAMAMVRSSMHRAGLGLDGLAIERCVKLPFPSDADQMRTFGRMGAAYRPFQLMLLEAMVSRGADNDSPLVFARLPLCRDTCDIIRMHLHKLPTYIDRAEIFSWHMLGDDAVLVKRARYETVA